MISNEKSVKKVSCSERERKRGKDIGKKYSMLLKRLFSQKKYVELKRTNMQKLTLICQ